MRGRKSERLRLSDVRAVFRLVDECRDLGADPEAWRSHITRSLGSLIGGQVSMSGEAAKPVDGSTPGFLYQAVDHGWATPSDRDIWTSHLASEAYRREPILQLIQAFGSRMGLCARHQVIDDSTWFSSPYYNETHRVCGLDEILVSFKDIPGSKRQNLVSVLRPRGQGVFLRRERRLIRLFHTELAQHFGSALTTLDDPNPAALTPRLRDTLRCLLEGDSEKLVAARLGLSTFTVHEYIKALYRHFRVSSRGELMAYFLRRSGFRLPMSGGSD
jgi:DNA-binding CsgD family transcriptional regulator